MALGIDEVSGQFTLLLLNVNKRGEYIFGQLFFLVSFGFENNKIVKSYSCSNLRSLTSDFFKTNSNSFEEWSI